MRCPSLRTTLFAFALAWLLGCDKQGIFPYKSRTDIVTSCGLPASVHLHSSEDATEVLIMGTVETAKPVVDASSHCMMVGRVARDSSVALLYGGYELDSSGEGIFYMTAEYEYRYQPTVSPGARSGASRDDSEPPFQLPMTLSSSGDQTTLTVDGSTFTYTALPSVLANIDLSTAQGPTDLFQVYNMASLIAQARVPAFGGLGMTRYIGNTTTFKGLVSGDFSVGVGSIASPVITFRYGELEDFPGLRVDGGTVADVGLNASGHTTGTIDFDFHDPTNPSDIRFAGSVEYDLDIKDGNIVDGEYSLTTTLPNESTHTISWEPSNIVDLRNILPVTP